MESNTRSRILLVVAALLIVLLGVWWYFGFSLEFMKFFAAEPGAVQRTVEPEQTTAIQAPREIRCMPAQQAVTVGQVVSLSAEGSREVLFEWTVPGGTIVLQRGDDIQVRYDTPGVKKVLVSGTPSYILDGSVESFSSCEVIVR